MSKDIQVLKFAVRRDKVRYGPGQEAGNIIYDLPELEAEKLIAESNGTIVELPRRKDVQQKAASSKKDKPDKGDGISDGAGGLLSIDPSATVK